MPYGRCTRAPSQRTGAVPTLIEWDNDIPPLATLAGQAAKADALAMAAERLADALAFAQEGLDHAAFH